jgi:ABC-type nitrate/sulfonate/bicarbonate transport system ATPase subunit
MNAGISRKEPLLTFQGASLSLGERAARKLILSNLNIQLRNIVVEGRKQGQVQGLLGPSGIGKTQFFKLIAGALQPDTGSVRLGIDQKPPMPGDVGIVPQNSVIASHLTVEQNLVFPALQSGLAKAEAAEKAGEMMNRFGLWDDRKKWPRQLSGGMRQRVAIGQQVLAGHKMICMDEPFASLDVLNIDQTIKLISELTADDELMTFIVVTHDVGAAIAISDSLWLMGRLRNPETKETLGASIVAEIDLVEQDLAWNPDIRHDPRFLPLEASLIGQFRQLANPE